MGVSNTFLPDLLIVEMKQDIIVILKNKSDQLIIQKIIDSFDIPLNIIHGLKHENVCKFLNNYFIPFLLIEATTEAQYQQIKTDIRSIDKNLVMVIYYNNSESKLLNHVNDYLNHIIYATDSHNQIANTLFKILGKQVEKSNSNDIQKKVRHALLLSLSTQEAIFVNLLLSGYTITKISSKQGISLSTVITIKKRVFEKFHVNSIIEFRLLFKDC